MDRKGPDLWIIEYGLFHDLDQVVAQIKEVNKGTTVLHTPHNRLLTFFTCSESCSIGGD